jgi:hypothetical protein
VNFKVNKDKVRSRREYEASWKRLARYSLHRREELRGRGDIFQQRTAAFAGWVKLRLCGSQERERSRQGGLLRRVSGYHLSRRQRIHRDGEGRAKPGALARDLGRARDRSDG